MDVGAAYMRTLGWNRACGCQGFKGQRRVLEISLLWDVSRCLLPKLNSQNVLAAVCLTIATVCEVPALERKA